MCRVTSSQVGQIRPLRFKVQKCDDPSRRLQKSLEFAGEVVESQECDGQLNEVLSVLDLSTNG